VARTYATYNLGGTYYDVSASSSSQLYGGYTAESADGGKLIVAAVNDTAHKVLYYNGSVIEAVFSSSAGGYTACNEIVWGGTALPYLRSVPSPYDADYSFASWEVTYTAAELKSLAESYMKRIGQSGSFGSFVRLEISYTDGSGSNTVSGRATKATLIGSSGSVSATNDAVRTMLGLKSNLFKVYDSAAKASADTASTIDKVYVLNAEGNLVERFWQELVAVNSAGVTQVLGDLTAASMRSSAGLTSFNATSGSSGGLTSVSLQSGSIIIKGSGYGHGVGMSQYGAIGMAKAGYTAEEILRHYYGGENSSLLVIRNIG
jgi:stage II sporulation protein D